jgi:hypothetical protein
VYRLRRFRCSAQRKKHFNRCPTDFVFGLHFASPGGNVSNLQLNSNGTVKNLAGYDQITAIVTNARDGIDERQFRFTLRITF